MKKILSLLSLLVVGCSLFADTQVYNVTWTANTDDAVAYNLFVWEGQDSTLCPFAQGLSVPTSSPTFRKQVNHPDEATTFIGAADGVTYISVALSAEDAAGKQSGIGWAFVEGTNSHFLKTVDATPPDTPQNVEFN